MFEVYEKVYSIFIRCTESFLALVIFLITLLFKIIATHWLFSWHVISTSPLLQRTTQSDHPVVLRVAQGQSHEACPGECPIRAVVFPSPVPSVVL